MNFKVRKKIRRLLLTLATPLPNATRLKIDRLIRGSKEFSKLNAADYVIVSFPKSGRTWLRAMISEYYRSKYRMGSKELLGFDNYHRYNSAIPSILFTHDNVIKEYSTGKEGKSHYRGKKLIFLARDPRDTAVSVFYHRKFRTDPYKVKHYTPSLYLRLHEQDEEHALVDCVLDQDFGVAQIVQFMNQWADELEKLDSYLLVRYEDMRKNTEQVFSRIMNFIEADVNEECVKSAVEFSAFENLKKLEQSRVLDAGSKRFGSKDMGNKNTMKVRKAKVGGFRDHFAGEDLKTLNENLKLLSPIFGYSLLDDDENGIPLT